MRIKRVYLCGPILGCSDEECKVWRREAAKLLNDHDIETIDPLKLRDCRRSGFINVTQIVEFDKIDILACDALIINSTRPSAGTSMEVLYAWERGKLNILVRGKDTEVSPWMWYHSHFVVDSLDRAIARIVEYG